MTLKNEPRHSERNKQRRIRTIRFDQIVQKVVKIHESENMNFDVQSYNFYYAYAYVLTAAK